MQITHHKTQAIRATDAGSRAATFMFLAAMMCFPLAAGAQTIYKQIDAAGRIVFSDRLDPDSRVVMQFLPPYDRPFEVSQQHVSAAVDAGSEVADALYLGTAMSSPRSLDIDIREAGRRLQQANQTRRYGIETNHRESRFQAPAGSR